MSMSFKVMTPLFDRMCQFWRELMGVNDHIRNINMKTLIIFWSLNEFYSFIFG